MSGAGPGRRPLGDYLDRLASYRRPHEVGWDEATSRVLDLRSWPPAPVVLLPGIPSPLAPGKRLAGRVILAVGAG